MLKIKKIDYIFGIIFVVHGWILTKIIFFPYPELFVYPYLRNAGLKPYGQIFDQHFPGLMFLPINLNNLGMTSEVIARWWEVGVVLLIQLILYVISLKVLRSRTQAVVVSLLYLIWQPFFEGYVLWIDSFLPLMLLPAFYFSYQAIISKRLQPVVLAGLFLGLGVVFKQIVLIPAGLALGVIWWYRRELKVIGLFLAGFLPLPSLMVIYFWAIGVLGDFWFWTVTFNLTTFAKYGKKPPFLSGLVRLAGVYGPGVGLILVDRPLAVMLAAYIIGGLAAIYARFDFVHLQPTLPLMMLATVAVMRQIKSKSWGKVAILVYCLMLVWWQVIFYRGHWGQTVLFFDPQTQQTAAKIRQLTHPGQEIFLWGPVLHLYYLSDTIPAGRVFVFQFPWFLRDAQSRVLAGLVQSQPELVVRDQSVVIEGQPITEFGDQINQYIDQHYAVFDRIGQTEFMRKDDGRFLEGI